MKICKFKDCNKEVASKDFCVYHYNKYGRSGKCGNTNCKTDYGVYAKGLCMNCYAGRLYANKPKNPIFHPCKVEGCNIGTKGDYCQRHRRRVERGLSTDLSINFMIGENNHNWNGGVADYPNHSQMKMLRRERIKQLGLKCQCCGVDNKRLDLHHFDGSKTNHTTVNTTLLCHKCHCRVHAIKVNGLTYKEIAQKVGCCYATVFEYLRGRPSPKYGGKIDAIT
jgi:hypothetical protein